MACARSRRSRAVTGGQLGEDRVDVRLGGPALRPPSAVPHPAPRLRGCTARTLGCTPRLSARLDQGIDRIELETRARKTVGEHLVDLTRDPGPLGERRSVTPLLFEAQSLLQEGTLVDRHHSVQPRFRPAANQRHHLGVETRVEGSGGARRTRPRAFHYPRQRIPR
jgi:hypothetical protein